jgi:uncharacterized protein involved in exopolysaccharide biosynthesis
MDTLPAPTFRDLLAVACRRFRLMAVSFTVIVLGAVPLLWLPADEYEASMKFLLRRERVDPVVSVDAAAAPRAALDITEEQLRSEVELLRSRDLLEKTVVAAGGTGDDLDQAVRDLAQHLRVEPLTRTNLIVVRYRASDSRQSVRLLDTLADLYIEKHLAVHRTGGLLEFFQQEADRYRQRLEQVEGRLAAFGNDDAIAPVSHDGEPARLLAEFDARSRDAGAAMAEAAERVRAIERQLSATPERQVTQVRVQNSHQLQQEARTRLLELELKRTALLMRYQPSYAAVVEVDQQIAQAKLAVEAAEGSSLREETIDRNPVHDMLLTELARSRTDLSALQARAAALDRTVAAVRRDARRSEQEQRLHQVLLRDARLQEENYLRYVRKREDARIADALDQRRILNVSLVEPPAASPLTTSTLLPVVMLLAGLVSVGLALTAEYMDPTVRTADEARAVLDLPVLASIPRQRT